MSPFQRLIIQIINANQIEVIKMEQMRLNFTNL